jgi:hypothetical protein
LLFPSRFGRLLENEPMSHATKEHVEGGRHRTWAALARSLSHGSQMTSWSTPPRCSFVWTATCHLSVVTLLQWQHSSSRVACIILHVTNGSARSGAASSQTSLIWISSLQFPLLTSSRYGITNFMELSPSWEAASCAATQEFPNILWDPNTHCRVQTSPPLVPFLCQINPVCKLLTLEVRQRWNQLQNRVAETTMNFYKTPFLM